MYFILVKSTHGLILESVNKVSKVAMASSRPRRDFTLIEVNTERAYLHNAVRGQLGHGRQGVRAVEVTEAQRAGGEDSRV